MGYKPSKTYGYRNLTNLQIMLNMKLLLLSEYYHNKVKHQTEN
jgi:hypothetical protein